MYKFAMRNKANRSQNSGI